MAIQVATRVTSPHFGRSNYWTAVEFLLLPSVTVEGAFAKQVEKK